ncbi:influenza virus NS1A-binding protein homolog B isoform X2 [Brachyhypopomus gauderio]
MERVKQICGDYLLSKMDCQSAIAYRSFASSMGDDRLLSNVDAYIQEHLLEIAEKDNFLKLPRLKLEVMLDENLNLPSNDKLYCKVINWVQHSLWESGEPLEKLMDEVQTLHYSADHRLHSGDVVEGRSEGDDDHGRFVQKKAPRESVQRQSVNAHCGFSSNPCGQPGKHEWRYIASEKTTSGAYVCLAVLKGALCVVSLHERCSPHSSPASTPCLQKSLSLEAQGDEPHERALASMHYARSGLGTAALDGRLIAAGGYNREECLRTVECYDPVKDSWTFICPMRTPRARFQMAVLMGQLYVMGGSNGHSDELSCGETYDPTSDEWTRVPELRMSRCNAGVCSLQNRLFVVGGSDPCGQNGLRNCDSFDPVSRTWSKCASLNIRRHQAAVCQLDGFMYAIGGAELWNCLNSVERYNPGNNTWTPVASMNVARRGAGVAVCHGKLFVVGGFDGSHALRCVEVYDSAINEWRMLGSMSAARSNAGVAVLDGVVYVVGGFDGNDFLNTMEVYDPESNEWSPCVE